MTNWLQDLRLSLRSLVRTPRFTIPAALALALGIGATTAVFSVVRGVLLEPLPYRDPERVVIVWEHNFTRNNPRNVVGAANFAAWRERNRSFEALGMAGPARLTVQFGLGPEEISGLSASAAVFPALGVQPAVGRAYRLDEDEEGRDAVIVISHELWQTRLGARPDVLGSTLVTNGRARDVIGVMPAGFTYLGQRPDFLVPYGWTEARLRAAPGRGSSHGVARLREGVSLAQASDDMRAIAAQLEQEAPQRNTGWSVTLVPIYEQTVDAIRPALLVLSAAAGLVLLIACVNVANLLLARGTVRGRELGVRAALGAGRGQLLRQLLSDSLVLGALGGGSALVLALLFHRGLLALVGPNIPVPRLQEVSLDLPALAFAAGVTLATAVLFGFVPALVSVRGVSEHLRAGGRHGGGLRARRALASLVLVELALSVVLLAGAGVLLRSFWRLQAIAPGFDPANVLTARVQVPALRYPDASASSGFFTSVVDRARQLPGVEATAGVSFLPLAGPGMATSFYRTDQPAPAAGEAPTTEVRPVTPGFFRAMRIPQLAGRDFSAADSPDSVPVAIVSRLLAERHLAGVTPLGARVHVNIGQPGGRAYEIVGVVDDIRIASLEGDLRPAVYIPHTQLAVGVMTVVVRSAIPPDSLRTSLAGVVRGLDPEVPLADVRVMADVVGGTLARPRLLAVLVTVFAAIALTLAAVGVYGVIAYSVAQRTQEFGVRMALGATPRSVFRLVLRESLALVAIGVGVGVVAAAASGRLLRSQLYQTEPIDPLTFGLTASLLLLVAAFAAYVPARRGTRIAPVEALRAE